MVGMCAPLLDLRIGSVRRAHTVLLYELLIWIHKFVMGQCSRKNKDPCW